MWIPAFAGMTIKPHSVNSEQKLNMTFIYFIQSIWHGEQFLVQLLFGPLKCSSQGDRSIKKLLSLLIILSISMVASAQISLREVRTASNNILVAYFMSPQLADVNTTLSQYKLNGVSPQSIAQFSTLNRGTKEHWTLPLHQGYEHHVYLTVPPLVNGTSYTLVTPHGTKTFTFDERTIFCESIKTNQSGYSALSQVRFANFSIWLGTGGSKTITGALPAYDVVDIRTDKSIAAGTLQDIGESKDAGDHVYRIDLSAVPEGGPYKIVVKGNGCSCLFGVGGMFSSRLSHIQFRGLLHERCCMELLFDNPTSTPALTALPPQRQFIDSHRAVSLNEFTVMESLTYPAALYPVLAKGGVYDGKTDPFDPTIPTGTDNRQSRSSAPLLSIASVQLHEKSLQIALSGSIGGSVTVELFSMQGKRIIRQASGAFANSFTIALPGASVVPGLYLCRVRNGAASVATIVNVMR
jgi:hypothetical protein